MIRNVCVGLLRCAAALTVLVLVTVCCAGYLATREPGFYVELKSQEFSSSEQKLAELKFRQLEKDFERWREHSLSRQRAQGPNADADSLEEPHEKYDPTEDMHVVSITDRQLNAMLAAAETETRGEWQKPRVRIVTDRIDVACEIVTDEVTCVACVELQPSVTGEGRLQLDIVSAQVGKLPLPLETLWSWLPKDTKMSNADVELDLTSSTPRLRWRLVEQASNSPTIRSVDCRTGEIAIKLSAPVLMGEQPSNEEAPLAVFGSK